MTTEHRVPSRIVMAKPAWRLLLTDRRWLLSLAGVVVLSVLYTAEIRQRADWPTGTDFYKFYLSSQYLLQGKRPYWPAPINDSFGNPCNDRQTPAQDPASAPTPATPAPIEVVACLHPNLNPPVFAVLTAPLTWLPYPAAWWIWSLASIGCGILALVLIFRARVWSAVRTPAAAMLIGVAFFAYFPTFANVSYGQVALFLLLLLTLAWLALRRGDDWKAGAWLGVAASLKPFVGLFLLTLLFSRNWRASIAFLIVCACAFLLGGLVVGFDAYIAYQAALDGITWQAASWNASFSGFFSRIFGGSENTPWIDAPIIAQGLTVLCSLGILALLGRVLWQSAGLTDHAQRADALFALTIPAMLLISPLGWMYYFPLLLIPLIVIWNQSISASSHTERLLLGLVGAATLVPTTLLPSESMNDPINWFRDAGPYVLALIIILMVSFYVINQVRISFFTKKVLRQWRS